ncbi:MAG TPA: hypothetical protein VFP46_02540 [Candidatus Paceibacterota bacterium]|nr:hypothetical protein [Candidatus Paceibacterota bacterium]
MKKSTKRSAAVAAGVAAAGAIAAAGYYFYGHKNAKRHREAAKKWVKDFKSDVLREARKLENVTSRDIDAIVDNVSKTYQGMKNVDVAALAEVASELKRNWQLIQGELNKVKRRRPVRKAAKKAKRAVSRTAK